MSDNLAYQEELRQELIGGKIVAMSPAATNHNRISRNISRIFGNYLFGRPCEPFGDGESVFLTKVDHFVPDFMVVCDPAKIKWNGVHGAPDLVVEILSPGTARQDRGHKKDVYESCGVREYWIVNSDSRSVEQYLSENSRFQLHAVYTHYPNYMLAEMSEKERAEVVTEFRCSLFDDLTISLADIFYRIDPPEGSEIP